MLPGLNAVPSFVEFGVVAAHAFQAQQQPA